MAQLRAISAKTAARTVVEQLEITGQSGRTTVTRHVRFAVEWRAAE